MGSGIRGCIGRPAAKRHRGVALPRYPAKAVLCISPLFDVILTKVRIQYYYVANNCDVSASGSRFPSDDSYVVGSGRRLNVGLGIELVIPVTNVS